MSINYLREMFDHRTDEVDGYSNINDMIMLIN